MSIIRLPTDPTRPAHLEICRFLGRTSSSSYDRRLCGNKVIIWVAPSDPLAFPDGSQRKAPSAHVDWSLCPVVYFSLREGSSSETGVFFDLPAALSQLFQLMSEKTSPIPAVAGSMAG